MRTQPRRGDRVAGLYDLGRKLQNWLANGSRRRGAEPRTTGPTDEPFRGNNLIFHAAWRSVAVMQPADLTLGHNRSDFGWWNGARLG